MEDDFEIIKLNNEPYDFLIIATSYENPLGLIKEIGEKIQVNKAKLLFDLTLITGLSSNRYIQCDYDAASDLLPPCAIIEEVDSDVQEISREFFASHEDIVKGSVLPDALKFLLKSGTPLFTSLSR